MGHLELCDDVLGPPGVIEAIRHQGKAEQAGVEGEDDIVLDRNHDGRGSGFCNYGFATSVVSRGGERKCNVQAARRGSDDA